MHLVNESLHGPGYEQFSEQNQNLSFVGRVLGAGPDVLACSCVAAGARALFLVSSKSSAREASCCLEATVEVPGADDVERSLSVCQTSGFENVSERTNLA